MTGARLDRLDRQTGRLGIDLGPRLEPEGTARQRFLRARGQCPDDLHAALYARAAALDVPPALVDAARRLVELAFEDRGLREPATEATVLVPLLIVVIVDATLGSTRTPVVGDVGRRHLEARLTPLVGAERASTTAAEAAELVRGGLPGIVAPPSAPAEAPALPLIFDGESLATHRLWTLEQRVVRGLAERRSTEDVRSLAEVSVALDDVQSRPALRAGRPAPLSDEQARAVTLAAQRRLTVISGGPGTGKTSVAAGLVRTLGRLGVSPDRMFLAAPTGKAAHRLTESLRMGLSTVAEPTDHDERLASRLPAAETLHRLLGYSPRLDRFARDRMDPLAADVVIVDEASMVDLRLMDALLDGLIAEAQLVLLGDADQLPSVDAGAVLRDLRHLDREMTSGPAALAQLTHSYRMDAADPRGADILTAARALQHGVVASESIRRGVRRLAYAGFEQLPAETPEVRRRFLDAWVARHLSAKSYERSARRILSHREGAFRAADIEHLDSLMSRLNRFRLLTVTRGSALPTGADALNRAIHDRLATRTPGAGAFLPGEPVMMLRNDYDRGLFNGDIGVLMSVAVDQQAATSMAVFPTVRGYEPFPLAALQQDLSLAHAMTVHKAQGSEFDEVALILPDIDVPLLTREVLYTGLTRARQSIIVVGPPSLTARAAARPVVRYSGLAAGIASAIRQAASAAGATSDGPLSS